MNFKIGILSRYVSAHGEKLSSGIDDNQNWCWAALSNQCGIVAWWPWGELIQLAMVRMQGLTFLPSRNGESVNEDRFLDMDPRGVTTGLFSWRFGED